MGSVMNPSTLGHYAASCFGKDPLVPSINVVEHCPVDTGLVDKGGRTIWRAPEPMGFHARRA